MQHPRSSRRLDEFCIRLSVVCPKARACSQYYDYHRAGAANAAKPVSCKVGQPGCFMGKAYKSKDACVPLPLPGTLGHVSCTHVRTVPGTAAQVPRRTRAHGTYTREWPLAGLKSPRRHAGARSRSGELTCGTAWYRFVAARSSPRPLLQALNHWACSDQLRIIIINARRRGMRAAHTLP